jgi:regulatory protein
MEIISIEPYKFGLFAVLLDTKKKLYVSQEILIKYDLEVGLKLDLFEVKEIHKESLKHRAMQKATWLLSKRAYSVKEFRARMTNQFSEEIVDEIVTQFIEANLLNDERYAEELAYSYCEIKQYGRLRALQNMQYHGLKKEDCELALRKYDKTAKERISVLLLARFSNDLKEDFSYERKQKITNYFYNKGYRFEDINSAIKKCLEELEDIEDIEDTEEISE